MLAVLACGVSAGNVRKGKTPVTLAADATPDAAFQARVNQVMKGQTFMLVHKGDAVEQEGAGQGPVNMQVPDTELKKITSSLSSKCNAQFSAMLDGKGPKLHHFSASTDAEESKAECSSLEGLVCHTKAQISEDKDMQGRTVKSQVMVEGDGCLPNMCMGEGDLKVLATFMQGKAKETIPGSGVEVNLHVDCSGSGGAIASVAPDGAVVSNQMAPGAVLAKPPHDVLKSSAAGVSVGASLLAVGLSLF